MTGRHLDWEGCFNARDLGGLRTANGRMTVSGRLVRADALSGLTSAGWAALVAYGVRTVIDLRNDEEVGGDVAARPASVTTLRLPLDAVDEREFWNVWDSGPQFGTPLYYRPHIERFPERSAAVVAAIARAGPGGVAFHCGGGRDRVGQISMLVLALAGVAAEEIAADYALSASRLPARYAALREESQEPVIEAFLAERGVTAPGLIASLVRELDVEAVLERGGLTPGDVAARGGGCWIPEIEESGRAHPAGPHGLRGPRARPSLRGRGSGFPPPHLPPEILPEVDIYNHERLRYPAARSGSGKPNCPPEPQGCQGL